MAFAFFTLKGVLILTFFDLAYAASAIILDNKRADYLVFPLVLENILTI
jgi:hypothetical protein